MEDDFIVNIKVNAGTNAMFTFDLLGLSQIRSEVALIRSFLMATRQELVAKLNTLNDAVVAEKAEVAAALEELKTAVEALTAKVAELENVDFSEEVASVDAALAAVAGIYETEVVEPEPEVIE